MIRTLTTVPAAINRCIVFSSLVLIATSLLAADTSDLPTSARRYGELMVRHWLTIDLLRVSERALLYRPDFKGHDAALARLQDLQQSMLTSEHQLDDARDRYKKLLKTNIVEEITALGRLLDDTGASEAKSAKAAQDLLQDVGEQTSGAKFQALPVSDEQLAPAWNTNVIGKNFQPKRILFGSTGQAADDRILPLRFDFGGGLFSFYATMASPDKLALDDTITKRTSAAFDWMASHHFGYHYWAGLYNNQNTYVADWFRKAHAQDDDIWMKLVDGKVLKSGGDWGQVNIWNHDVQNYFRTYCETQARTFAKDPSLVCYDYTAEPHPWASQPPGQAQYGGYNESALSSFHQYLQKKFTTIAKLNAAWKSSYATFDSIPAPPDPYVTSREKATPLSYEFERFRWDTTADIWKIAYDGYRTFDKTKPIVANASMFMSGWPVEALDAYRLQKTGAADWIDMHMNNFPPNLPEQIYLYSLCRLTGKVPVQFEYIWTFPRTKPFDDKNEADFRATCEASVWRNLAWGKKVFVFFDFYYDWPAYHNAFFDVDANYSILRPSGCVVPVMKRKAVRFNDLLLGTEVATPPIIILQPTTSVLNSPPVHPNQGFSFHTTAAQHGVHDLLFPHNYPFLYVPEEAVLEDKYDLSQHKVIVLPQAPYLPGDMVDRLLAWVKRGGTLISVGPPGLWNAYGQDDFRLLNKVFGKSEVTDAKHGGWEWSWRLLEKNADVDHVLNDADNKVAAASAHYGKGTVLVCANTFGESDRLKMFYATLDKAITTRPARCEKDLFELVERVDKQGHRFLLVLNPHTRETRQDEIVLAGKFSRCTDLGIGSGVPVPVKVLNRESHITLQLHPGESTVIALAQ